MGLLLVAPAAVAAQVGQDPAHSPYHDILHGAGWTVTVGQVYGDGAPLRLSPNSGTSLGVRYDIRFSRLMQGFVGLSHLALQREILAPDDSVVNRYSGPVDDPVWTPMLGMQFNITGAKSWHGIAPFFAVGLGAAFDKAVARDTSAFRFGTKLLFAPSAGLRYFVGERLHVRLEGEMLYWKMKYPSTWTREPSKQPSTAGQPTTAPVKNVAGLSDWVPTPGLKLGIGYSF
jgi:hypothetical protein